MMTNKKKFLSLPAFALSALLSLSACSGEELQQAMEEIVIADAANAAREEAIATVDRDSDSYQNAYTALESYLAEDDTAALTPAVADADLAEEGYPEDVRIAVIADMDDHWREQATVQTVKLVFLSYIGQKDDLPDLATSDDMDHDVVTEIEETVAGQLEADGYTDEQIEHAMSDYADHSSNGADEY